MNTDELKALVEVLKTVSGDARTVLVWYFAIDIFRTLLWWAFWLLLIQKLLRIPWWMISANHVSRKIAEHIGADPDIDRPDHHNLAIHKWVDGAIARDKKKQEP